MIEGSDGRLALLADSSEIDRRARVDRARRALEEWRVQRAPLLADPGATHDWPDEAPPASEPHPTFATEPPAQPGIVRRLTL